MKTPTITSEQVAQAIDDNKVRWQVHTMYNRLGLETEDIREATCLVSKGLISGLDREIDNMVASKDEKTTLSSDDDRPSFDVGGSTGSKQG